MDVTVWCGLFKLLMDSKLLYGVYRVSLRPVAVLLEWIGKMGEGGHVFKHMLGSGGFMLATNLETLKP